MYTRELEILIGKYNGDGNSSGCSLIVHFRSSEWNQPLMETRGKFETFSAT